MSFVRWILVTAMCLMLSPPLHAQLSVLEVEAELDRTDMVIEQASDAIRDAGNDHAADLVERAVEIQLQARAAFDAGRLLIAQARTRAARTLAERALALVLRPEERLEQVELELQTTDEKLAEAHDKLQGVESGPGRALLDLAERQQQQAWELFRSDRLRPALRLTQQVRQMIQKALVQVGSVNRESLLLELEVTAELVRQASDSAEQSGERRWIELAHRAQELLAIAQRHADADRLQAAWQVVMQARRVAEQVLARSSEPDSSRKNFERAKAHYEELADRLRQRLVEEPNEEAAALLAQSQIHFGTALEIAAGNPNELWRAMAEMRIAFRLLTQTANLMK